MWYRYALLGTVQLLREELLHHHPVGLSPLAHHFELAGLKSISTAIELKGDVEVILLYLFDKDIIVLNICEYIFHTL